MKKKNKPLFSQLNYFLVFVTVVLTLAFAVIKYKLTRNYVSRVSQNSTAIQSQLDTENDGIYMDYKYAFSFEYPNQIFKYQNKAFDKDNHRSLYWDRLEDGSSYIGGKKEGGFISLSVNETPVDFDKLYSSPVGRTTPKGYAAEFQTKKVRELSVPDGKGMIYDDLTEYSNNTVHLYAAWKRGENTFWLTVSTNNQGEVEQFSDIFEKVVNSFKFF